MPQNINIILSLVNLSEKKLQYQPISSLDEVNKLFQNNTIAFSIAENKYVLSYNPANLEIQVKAPTPTPKIIATFDPNTTLEQIFQTFGKL